MRELEQEDDGDPRLAFVYQEAVRGLTHQQGVVESLNARAGNLVFAAAFATSLLGARALADGLGVWDWVAVALLFAVGVAVTFMLWPWHSYTFRFDPQDLLDEYVDSHSPASLSAMHRSRAAHQARHGQQLARDPADSRRAADRADLPAARGRRLAAGAQGRLSSVRSSVRAVRSSRDASARDRSATAPAAAPGHAPGVPVTTPISRVGAEISTAP